MRDYSFEIINLKTTLSKKIDAEKFSAVELDAIYRFYSSNRNYLLHINDTFELN